ncbi:MAG TPA: ATP-binding protein [Smithella sp.]|nr:tRNA 2-thiocytidine(32) synthetase TtcA [Smithella sp.]HNY50562.1 ATP-binding protein [Smithella sp.]HOG90284.1 ATP-binding protein [Smithella sp.]HOU51035.1 ATP-binding protein [Smithella sp.]HQI73288.1 ATP-binding protein [Smithella sp.]
MKEIKKDRNTKLFLHLKKWLEKAILDYKMIQKGDHLLIGVSGGADSLALLDLLDSPMLFIPDFSFVAVNIDMGFDPTYEKYDRLEKYFQEHGYRYVMEKTNIGNLAHSDFNKKNPCFLCSRLRRKRIFEIADAEDCNKIAFAHHRDDIIETLLINIFYGREISTMMPNQSIFGGKLHIIRPLVYLREELVKKYSKERQFPVLKNDCPTSQTSKRIYIKKLLRELEKDNKEIRDNIYKAMSHVKPDYLVSQVKNERNE